MKILFIIVCLVFLFGLLFSKGGVRLSVFLAGILFFPHTIVVSQVLFTWSFTRVMIYGLLLVTLYEIMFSRVRVKESKFVYAYFMALIPLLLVGLFNNRGSFNIAFIKPLQFSIEYFLVLPIVFLNIRDREDIWVVFRSLFVFSCLMGAYGFVNAMTGRNEYMDLISSIYGVRDMANSYTVVSQYHRFRVSSFSYHPIQYGLFVSVFLLFVLFFLENRFIRVFRVPLIVAGGSLLSLNLLLVNSRTPILALGVGVFVWYVFRGNIKKSFLSMFVLVLVTLVVSFTTQKGRESFEMIYDIIATGGKNQRGSSVELRQVQLQASYNEFLKSPIVGNGFGYIGDELGFTNEREGRTSAREFAGFESYLYVLLIEQGLLGILSNLVFFGYVGLYFFRALRFRSNEVVVFSAMGLSVLSCFVVFIMGTGSLGTFPFVMTVLALFAKGISIETISLSHLH